MRVINVPFEDQETLDFITFYVKYHNIRNTSNRIVSLSQACYSIVACWVDEEKERIAKEKDKELLK